MTDTPERTCFTIMPFGGWQDQYYKTVYKPAIAEAGLLPQRADDLSRTSTIINDIWAFTKEATIVLADLTEENPNVFYELGLAHALATSPLCSSLPQLRKCRLICEHSGF